MFYFVAYYNRHLNVIYLKLMEYHPIQVTVDKNDNYVCYESSHVRCFIIFMAFGYSGRNSDPIFFKLRTLVA